VGAVHEASRTPALADVAVTRTARNAMPIPRIRWRETVLERS